MFQRRCAGSKAPLCTCGYVTRWYWWHVYVTKHTVQICRNPALYGIRGGGQALEPQLQQRFVQTTVASLTEHGFVSTDQDGFALRAEVPGEIMAQVMDTRVVLLCTSESSHAALHSLQNHGGDHQDATTRQPVRPAARAVPRGRAVCHPPAVRGAYKQQCTMMYSPGAPRRKRSTPSTTPRAPSSCQAWRAPTCACSFATPTATFGPGTASPLQRTSCLCCSTRRSATSRPGSSMACARRPTWWSDTASALQPPWPSMCVTTEHTAYYSATVCLRYYMHQGHFAASANALTLSRSMRLRLWDNTTLPTRQLPNVGQVTASRLRAAGITSLRDLAARDPRWVEQVTTRHYPFGTQLQHALTQLLPPRMELLVQPLRTHALCGHASMHHRVRVAGWWACGAAGTGQAPRGAVVVPNDLCHARRGQHAGRRIAAGATARCRAHAVALDHQDGGGAASAQRTAAVRCGGVCHHGPVRCVAGRQRRDYMMIHPSPVTAS